MLRTETQVDPHRDGDQVGTVSEALAHHVERIPDPILLLDADLVIRHITAQVTTLLGWEPADVIGRPIAEFLAPEDLPLVLGLAAEHLPVAGYVREVEVHVRRRDGSVRMIEASASTFLHDPEIG